MHKNIQDIFEQEQQSWTYTSRYQNVPQNHNNESTVILA